MPSIQRREIQSQSPARTEPKDGRKKEIPTRICKEATAAERKDREGEKSPSYKYVEKEQKGFSNANGTCFATRVKDLVKCERLRGLANNQDRKISS